MARTRIDTGLLDSLVIGRVEPHIYAFTTGTVPNYLKVGDTYRPVTVRIREWSEIYPALRHVYTRSARIDDNTIFRDFQVHEFLVNTKGRRRLKPDDIPNIPYYSREFFHKASKADIDEAIDDIHASAALNDGRYRLFNSDHLPKTFSYTRGPKLEPRANQAEVIRNFERALELGRSNLLMFAVMRFGKSFTAMCCASRIDARLVLVVSAKADVKDEWQKTVQSIGNFEKYIFAEKTNLVSNPSFLRDTLGTGRNVVLFLTLQDLQGDDLKQNHREVFDLDWDLLIVDETHFGARADQYGKILNRRVDLTVLQRKKERDLQLKDIERLDQLDESVKELKKELRVRITMHLSGTPYRILMGSEFQKEDIIAFVQFSDIADAQRAWTQEHKYDESVPEWKNPYFGFPQMVRFAFSPNQASLDRIAELRANGATTSFSELFRPKSMVASNPDFRKFVHEDVVLDFLKVIDGSKNDSNVLGFLDNERIQHGKLCRHMVIVLPYCASCDAMEELLTSHSGEFKNLGDYEILNISGLSRPEWSDDTKKIKNMVASCEAAGKRSVTLTVNRMLTGNTVPQWDTMIFLKQTASPEEYDQAIFRLQNPFIDEYEASDGSVIRFNMKPQTILVDFDPERVFRLQERKSLIYNLNTNARGAANQLSRIAKELEISPIIVLDHNKLREVTPANVIDAVRDYSSTRSMIDEACDLPVDLTLLDIDKIRNIVSALSPIDAKKGLSIKAVTSDDGQDIDAGQADEGDASSPKSDSSSAVQNPPVPVDEKDIEKRFTTYYALILFFGFLSDDVLISLEDIVAALDSSDENQRLSRSLGLSKDILEVFLNNLNGNTLNILDKKIQNINEISRDESKTPYQKVEIALTKFGRMSESEIVTPQKVADEVVSILPDNIFELGPVLDIASKQGEFTFALLRRYGEVARDKTYALCTSPLAYEFTRKVYKLLGLPIQNIFSEFITFDLINNNEDRVLDILRKMKFSTIIGNPPYHEEDGGAGASSKPIYNEIYKSLIGLSSRYMSVIMPARWYAGGKGLEDFRADMMADRHLAYIKDYSNSRDLFPGVIVGGGICYILRDSEYEGKCLFDSYYAGKSSSMKRYLDEYSVLVRFNSAVKIIDKVSSKTKNYINSIISTRNPYSVSTNQKGLDTEPDCPYYILHTKRGKRFIDRAQVRDNENIKQYRVMLGRAISGHAGETDENGQVKVISTIKLIAPNEVCTDTYIVAGAYKKESEASNLLKYLCTKFVRILMLQTITSINITRGNYRFVPIQDFTDKSDIDWSKNVDEIDRQLYEKYKLSDDEIAFIESMIKSM